MIKLLHTADWHLGKMLFGRSMLDDQRYFFDNYFFPTLEQRAFGENDAVVLAGDIFDRAVPPVAALELFDDVITRLARMGVRLFAVTGNHDGASRLSMGTRLMRDSGIYLYTNLADCSETLELSDGEGCRVMLHPLPHFDLAQGKSLLRVDAPAKYSEIYSGVVGGCVDVSDKAARHVLVSHCTVVGSLPTGDYSLGGSDEVGAECFDGFDLALLGHIHSDMAAGGCAVYSGSPLAYAFGSRGTTRSMRYYELSADEIRCERIMIDAPLHPMITMTGAFDSFLSDETPASDAFIFFELTDTELIYEPMQRLREKFPGALGMSYTERGTGVVSAEYRRQLRSRLRSRSVSDSEVFTAFLEQICGVSPTDDDMTVFAELCREAAEAEDAQ